MTAFFGLFFDDNSAGGGPYHECLSDLPGALEGLDFAVGDVEVLQPPPGRGQKPCPAVARQALGALESHKIFFLRRYQFRRIDFKKRLAFRDGFAGEINVQGFDPAAGLGTDLHCAGFVVGHVSVYADGAGQRLLDDRRGSDTHVLLRHRVDEDVDAADQFVFIDWHQLHAHGALAWLLVNFLWVHGCAPVCDCALTRGRGGSRCIPLGNEVHAADGALAGLIRHNPGVHRGDV